MLAGAMPDMRKSTKQHEPDSGACTIGIACILRPYSTASLGDGHIPSLKANAMNLRAGKPALQQSSLPTAGCGFQTLFGVEKGSPCRSGDPGCLSGMVEPASAPAPGAS